jgi:uncharacterized Zn-binding protein involved in type VI secretion
MKGLWNGSFITYSDRWELESTTRPVNFADLQDPVPAVAWAGLNHIGACKDDYFVDGVCPPIVDGSFEPQLAIPDILMEIDPAWKNCAKPEFGAPDPPIAFRPVETLAAPTLRPLPSPTSAVLGVGTMNYPPASPASMASRTILPTEVPNVIGPQPIPLTGGSPPDGHSQSDTEISNDPNPPQQGKPRENPSQTSITVGDTVLPMQIMVGNSGIPNTVILGSKTLSIGGSAAIIESQTVSLGGGGIIIGTKTIPLPPSVPSSPKSAAVINLGGGQFVTASGDRAIVIGSATLTPGGSAYTTYGHIISMDRNGNVIMDGKSSVSFTVMDSGLEPKTTNDGLKSFEDSTSGPARGTTASTRKNNAGRVNLRAILLEGFVIYLIGKGSFDFFFC